MSGRNIKYLDLRQVYSIRGYPAVEAVVVTENGAEGRAICATGVSVGTHEIPFKYDGGTKFNGRGTTKTAAYAKEALTPLLLGQDAAVQQHIDNIMLEFGKDIVGGNATAAVSAAVLKAGAASLGIPLYQHIGGARARTLPVPGTLLCFVQRLYNEGPTTNKPTYSYLAYDFDTFEEASYALWVCLNGFEKKVKEKWGLVSGFIPGMFAIPMGCIKSDEEIWALATENIIQCGYEGKVGIQVDVASDSYYDHDTKIYEGLFEPGRRDRDEQIEFLCKMVRKYPFVCLEDPLYEDDFEGTAILTQKVDIQIVGDDLFTTNSARVKEGAAVGAANCVLLKVNQIGTISEALDMVQVAYDNGYNIMPCMSRGEGVEICDYSVGINAGSIRESGLGDYGNRFLEIERELGNRAHFAGKRGLMGKRFR
jgi:enolase